MERYQVFLNYQILEEIPRTGKSRSAVLAFIASLGNDPFQAGDYSEVDEVGRPIFTKIVGRYAVTFWPDTPDRSVKIVKVEQIG